MEKECEVPAESLGMDFNIVKQNINIATGWVMMWAGAAEFILFMRSCNFVLGKFYFMLLFLLNVLFFETTAVREWYVPSSAWSIKWQLRKKHNISNCIGNEKQPIKIHRFEWFTLLSTRPNFQDDESYSYCPMTSDNEKVGPQWQLKIRTLEHKLVSCTAHVNIVTVNVEI
jgi:hypothetical protein